MRIRPGRCYTLAEIGSAVRAARERAGDSQRDAASLCGLAQPHVSAAEGGSKGHLKALRLLALRYLSVELADEPSFHILDARPKDA